MNQNPEQLARDQIDQQLLAAGWVIQNKSQINLAASLGLPFVNTKPMVGEDSNQLKNQLFVPGCIYTAATHSY